MNNEAFSEIRALLSGGAPPLPDTMDAHFDYKEWHQVLIKSFRAMFNPFQLPDEKAEIWSVLNPYLEAHPTLLKTLGGITAAQGIMRSQKLLWNSLVPATAYALTLHHHDMQALYAKGRMPWVAGHFKYGDPPMDYLAPQYKDPFPCPNYHTLFGQPLRYYGLSFPTTIFGGVCERRALRVGSVDIFVSVHKTGDFYEDKAKGLLRGYTKDFVLSDEGNDWMSYSMWRQDYDPEDDYSPDKRFEALLWKAENNIYATVLVDPSGFMTYIPNVCYDLHLPESGHGFYYDCYE